MNKACKSRTRLYVIWANMKQRCYNSRNPDYKYYGGRGIRVCAQWVDNFDAFEEWAYSNGYREYLTIDRIDNNKGYCPANCRWATPQTQAGNQRPRTPVKDRNAHLKILVEIEGISHTYEEWAQITGVNPKTIRARKAKGYIGKDLIKPTRERG